MRISIRQITMLFLMFLAGAAYAQAQQSQSDPIRILFVGNSYTYVNDLPAVLSEMSRQGKQARPIETKTLAFSGASLEQHWTKKDVQQALQEQKWDYVVLQEHSMLPVKNPDFMYKYARLIDAEVKKNGAKTILYLTWARQNDPAMQAKLDKAYTTLANELGALLAPVGQAWQTALAEKPQPSLFLPDGSHPSFIGSYIGASVFYSLIYGQMPPQPSAAESKRLEKANAGELQQAAWKAVQSLSPALRTSPDKAMHASAQ
ncbi:DUF4886 domain-containing protein [Pseudomonas sp. MAG002Y]|uniref:DUF4886 domain-containing protein n=1 Tax=Pseudomonas sp. MAG002Y TaxID=2678690 RepID=UPI001C60FBDC|nr:DUF4886 domain-containing protein [Pseudomonas sp. MAG002Y]MBW5412049.1 SGNH/GDSL hydrolase family protein [Pseudomonas sp. MAG002Y]